MSNTREEQCQKLYSLMMGRSEFGPTITCPECNRYGSTYQLFEIPVETFTKDAMILRKSDGQTVKIISELRKCKKCKGEGVISCN